MGTVAATVAAFGLVMLLGRKAESRLSIESGVLFFQHGGRTETYPLSDVVGFEVRRGSDYVLRLNLADGRHVELPLHAIPSERKMVQMLERHGLTNSRT